MADFYLPPYCGDDLARVRDLDLIGMLKELIDEVMIENRLYYDDDYRTTAVAIIYPVIAGILFNTHFSHVRANKQLLIELTTYLVTHLS